MSTQQAQGTIAGRSARPGAFSPLPPVRSATWTRGYRRDAFGPSWPSGVPGLGACDARDVVLARDLVDVERRNGCTVTRGTLVSPYTGARVTFVRGPGTSTAVQVDHVVSLADAWTAGANGWTPAQRQRFANDPAELLAVDAGSNQAKSDHTTDEWLPRSPTGRCGMVTTQARVKARYRL